MSLVTLCYNSPCQLKIIIFEGLKRGSSKNKTFMQNRMSADSPTRLFLMLLMKTMERKGFFNGW